MMMDLNMDCRNPLQQIFLREVSAAWAEVYLANHGCLTDFSASQIPTANDSASTMLLNSLMFFVHRPAIVHLQPALHFKFLGGMDVTGKKRCLMRNA
jgi:hypothetical protein